MGTPALVIVDVQNDFCSGGALAVPDGDRVVPVLNKMIDRFEAEGHPIYATRDWHPPETTHFREFGGRWPPHCVRGTPGADLHPDLHVPADVILVSAGQGREDDGYSGFEGTTTDGSTFEADLRRRGVSELYVGGLATDYCVRATVLDARRHGFDVTVLADAIAGIATDTSERALEEIQHAGARVVSSDELER